MYEYKISRPQFTRKIRNRTEFTVTQILLHLDFSSRLSKSRQCDVHLAKSLKYLYLPTRNNFI